jgi:hypothetical protein
MSYLSRQREQRLSAASTFRISEQEYLANTGVEGRA